jgi:hypothetical protein
MANYATFPIFTSSLINTVTYQYKYVIFFLCKNFVCAFIILNLQLLILSLLSMPICNMIKIYALHTKNLFQLYLIIYIII